LCTTGEFCLNGTLAEVSRNCVVDVSTSVPHRLGRNNLKLQLSKSDRQGKGNIWSAPYPSSDLFSSIWNRYGDLLRIALGADTLI